jgi:hypothetical protein
MNVAGVMIADGATRKGVAPAANLLSAAVPPRQPAAANTVTSRQQRILLAAQKIATNQQAVGVNYTLAGINYSMYIPWWDLAVDGNSLVSKGLDWLSEREHLLNVLVRGNLEEDDFTQEYGPPSDSYNGIVVGATEIRLTNGRQVFRAFSTDNATGSVSAFSDPTPMRLARRLTDLVAPGKNIGVPTIPEGAPNGASTDYSAFLGLGASFAAPHVTGAVALLEQYAGLRGWGWIDPTVIKAVLMNSADKFQDNGNGLYLGMEKTLLNSLGQTWFFSWTNRFHDYPLDEQLGTGQLNVRRALNQFSSGQVQFQNPDGTPRPVPAIGCMPSNVAYWKLISSGFYRNYFNSRRNRI